MLRTFGPCVCSLLLLLFCISAATAAPTPAQQRELRDLNREIRKAGVLYANKKYKESSEVVKDVQQRVEKLLEQGDADLFKAVEPIHRRIVRAHALLELEGFTLPPLKKLEQPETPQPAPGEGISFTKQVAPLLVAKCGGCHVRNMRGEFSMATYARLMQGSAAGRVVLAGDASGSRMIEVIESGDMPRGGGSVADDELAMLKAWIAQGARYDGEDPRANLTMFAPRTGQNNADMPALQVMRATGNETISFALDIAPLLAENCNGCHVNARRVRGGLNMSNFAMLLRGGDSGLVIRPGAPASSLLVQRVKGEGDGPRMPQGRPPLSDEAIAKIENWIREGARFDGPQPNQNIVEVAALVRAQRATHEELTAERVALAERNWRLGMGTVKPARAETENFLLLGNVGDATLEQYAEQAEALAPEVAEQLGAPSDKPLLKGRLTLYFFSQRYDYAEFGQMIEKREVPREWRGHWRFSIIDAYGAVIPPREEEYTLDGLIGQQVAGAYVASLGSPPRWFAEGVARVVGSRLARKDPRIQAWHDELPRVLRSMTRSDDFLTGKLPAEDADIASYSFARFLMKDMKRFNALLLAMRNQQPFERSFAASYGAPPAKVSEIWARSAVREARRRR